MERTARAAAAERERLRGTFDAAAERYDRVRPGYPPALIDDLTRLAGIGQGSRVLEIGCGTGQVTVPLAQRGCAIVAVELGADMAAVARRNCAAFPAVRVVVSAFETWPLPREPFDAVVAATAFRWVDPGVRVTKAADALRPGGALATVTTYHVAGGTESFFAEVQACYERWDPATRPGFRLPRAVDVPLDSAELEQSGRFGPAVFRRYAHEVAYSRAAYLALLGTYSGHLALDAAARAGLFDCVGSLIDSRYGGAITKCYLFELRVAHRTT